MRVPSYLAPAGQVIDMWFLEPEHVDIEDIASTLAKINRYSGRTPYPYSVAQHAVLVAFLCPQEYAYEGLHHDDTEAFVGDVIGPVKGWLPWFKELENTRIRPAIAAKFGLAVREPGPVKQADHLALKLEQWHIQGWATPPAATPVFARELMREMTWQAARDQFLQMHESLGRRHGT